MICHHGSIELLRPDNQSGKLRSIAYHDCFGVIRSLQSFRLAGQQRDYCVISSDSGRVCVLEFDAAKSEFKRVQMGTFGKSGVRRTIAGEIVTVDPKGRAVMVSALEKQKVVYVLNRDQEARLTISSPLEANKAKTIVFDCQACDNGLENPGFMAIELFYGDADRDDTGEAAANAQKMLTYYELDLGLNHVARKWSNKIDNGANKLIPVPGGSDGPGGVIVCCENFLVYRQEKHEEVRCVIPRRFTLAAERGVLIASFASHRSKNGFFFIAQSEYGDCYKVTLDWTNRKVSELKMKYFDTIPVCSSLCVLKTGFLFAGSEFGAHALFQFIALGDDEESAESSSKTLKKVTAAGSKKSTTTISKDDDDDDQENFLPVFFNPRKLKNLALIDEIESLSPTMALASNISKKEETPRLLALCGQGPRSTFRVLRQGVPLSEMARSPLPGNPNGVYTIRKSKSDTTDAYIVVSFTNATLVLSIGDTVEEVTDTGILATSSTLAVSALGDEDNGSLIQIHPSGVRHVRGNNKGVNEWRAPGRKKITACACNRGQAIVALTGGELVYFELDEAGQLLEIEKVETSSEIVSVDIPPIPEGSLRAKFAAVAGYDSTVRILSLNPGEALRSVGVQATPSPPESVLLTEVNNNLKGNKKGGSSAPPSMFLNVGLSNGVLVRCEVDRVSGALSDARSRFVGQRPPKLNRIEMNGEAGFLALSTRPWLGFNENGRFSIVPACHETIDRACGFASEQVPEGIVAVADGSLRILACEKLGEAFSQSFEKSRYTPRAMSTHPDDPDVVAVIETDRGVVGFEDRKGEETKNEYVVEPPKKKLKTENDEDESEEDEDDAYQLAPIEQFGAPRTTDHDNNSWSSCVRIVDAANAETLCVEEIKNNERVVSITHAYFTKADEVLLVVGSAKNFVLQPRDCDGGMIRCYRYKRGSSNGETNGKSGGSKTITGLELVHETVCEGAPFAMRNFEGKLLVGVDDVLRMYDFGKKKLLRKSECAQKFPSFINSIRCSGDRFFVTDACESVFFVKFIREEECSMHIFADDVAPRYVTAMLPLDRDTVCVADKFGNFAALRLPKDVSDDIESDISGGKHASMQATAFGTLNGASNKLEAIAQFHFGDVVCSLTKCALQTGGSEVIIYATLGGALGALVPFASKDEADFCSHLEMHLRIESPPLLGNDHAAFRSSYFPVKNVCDGDLCEQFGRLSADAQRRISEEMDRTPSEIVKRLEQIRARAGS